jgi:hypothetical protein
MAIGISDTTAGKVVPLAEQFNGTEWQAQKPPADEEGEGWLNGGVSCVNKVWCAAVGNTGKTFVEMYR